MCNFAMNKEVILFFFLANSEDDMRTNINILSSEYFLLVERKKIDVGNH